MNGPTETRILCEGFHDRAFWAGWLTTALRCSEEGYSPNTPGFPRKDPWGAKIGSGHFAYTTPSGKFLRVVPCYGKDNIRPAVRDRLRERATKALTRVIVNVDPDVVVSSSASATGLRTQDVLALAREFDPAAQLTASGEIDLDGGVTKVSLVRWEANDPAAAGIPDQQTLERLVCAAVVAAYPSRAGVVKAWLDARPEAPPAGPKEHAWSYMTGWYADHGCQDFYSYLWRDSKIANQLRSRLTASGAWALVESAAQ